MILRGMCCAVAGALMICGASAQGTTHVEGYTTKNGTYVQPHYRTTPDSNPYNNWSTQGNVTPYTGQLGTHNASPPNNFGTGQGQPQYNLYGTPKRY